MASIFSLFIPRIQKAIEDIGFSTPTEAQIRAIPFILEGKNVLLIAPTGTGKTEAAFFPILNFLVKMQVPGIKVLYITPLRALNRDILERLQWWCKKLDIRLGVRHGDTEARERGAQAFAPPDVLITTPETLQAIILGKIMKQHLKSVKWVVVDEVHELADSKRGSQLSLALERLRSLAGDFQVIGLSATIGSPERVAKFLVGTRRPCEIVRVSVARFIQIQVLFPKPVREDYLLAGRLYSHPEVAARLRVMRELIDSHKSTLLFTNTRSIAEVLSSRFKVWDINSPIGVHHGSLSKTSRVSAERELKEGRLRGIVCTSSLELGIDIGSLDLVLQYNSPRQVTRLLQRVGRSGHKIGGIARGVVVTQDSDDFLEALVIARRSLVEDLEPVDIPEKPYDVLSHQLAGLLIEKNRWEIEECLELFNKAYPFRELSPQEVSRVLAYMSSRYPRLAYLPEEKTFIRPKFIKELYKYYFNNLSMIPEEKHFLVIEEETSAPIGMLDEAFVAENGEIGTKFVERGSVWKILHIYQDKIYVKGEEDPTGAIPSWVGEEIPVPYEIAQEVGKLRGRVEEKLKNGIRLEEIIKDVSNEYPSSIEDLERGLSEIVEQTERGLAIPTDKRITIEKWEEYGIIHCSFGLQVNKTLARLLGHIFSEKLGLPVGVQQDPYRIVLKGNILPEDIKKIMLEEIDVQALIQKALVKTGIFKRRIVHVARKFGALAKDADLSTLSLSSLIKSFEGSAIYDETLRTTLSSDADVEKTSEVLKRIREGEIDIAVIEDKKISPIARIGMEEIGRRYDLVPPDKMRRVHLESTKARLLSEAKTLICTSCWDYVEIERIKDLPTKITCPKCESQKIGVLDETEEKAWRLCEKMHISEEVPPRDRKILEKARKTSELVSEHGKRACIALAGRVSIQDAKEILEQKVTDERFFELIIEAERNALKRRFFVPAEAGSQRVPNE